MAGGIKNTKIFFNSSKRAKLYESSRTFTYHTANTFQIAGRI